MRQPLRRSDDPRGGVFVTEAMMVASSRGRSVRRSITSASIPSFASSSAASSVFEERTAVGDEAEVGPSAERTAARSMSNGACRLVDLTPPLML